MSTKPTEPTLAELALTNGAYTVFDTVVISVGTGVGPATVVGTPLANTASIVPGLLISAVSVSLDFVSLNDDKVTVSGIFDVTQFNNSLTGLSAQIAIAGKAFGPYTLDAKGSFVSAMGASPAVALVIAPTTGKFTFQVTRSALRDELSNIGMVNSTLTKNVPVPLTVTVGVGSQITQASVSTLYHATMNKNGVATYAFQGAGDEISGTFLISSFTATEVLKKEHTYVIAGQLVKPGKFALNTAGNITVYLGNYHFSMPAGQVLNKQEHWSTRPVNNQRCEQIHVQYSHRCIHAPDDQYTSKRYGHAQRDWSSIGEFGRQCYQSQFESSHSNSMSRTARNSVLGGSSTSDASILPQRRGNYDKPLIMAA